LVHSESHFIVVSFDGALLRYWDSLESHAPKVRLSTVHRRSEKFRGTKIDKRKSINAKSAQQQAASNDCGLFALRNTSGSGDITPPRLRFAPNRSRAFKTENGGSESCGMLIETWPHKQQAVSVRHSKAALSILKALPSVFTGSNLATSQTPFARTFELVFLRVCEMKEKAREGRGMCRKRSGKGEFAAHKFTLRLTDDSKDGSVKG
jgi:hypothetical protein